MTAPRISLVIPAYNEAQYLPALLDSVDRAKESYVHGADAIEVIVGNNASTDATAAIATARHCQVALIEKRAIAAARNGGAALATGDIVAFIDADSRIHPDTFNAIESTMARNDVIVGATRIWPDRWSLGIAATWAVALPIVYLTRVDSGVIFCRRADFLAVGGYDESLHYAEDIQLLLDLKKLGKARGQGFARARGVAATTSTRKFHRHGHWHYFTQMPLVALGLLFDRARVHDYARKYWYEDR